MLYPIENAVREVKNLSGIWNFKVDFENKGFDECWYSAPLQDTMPMAVPASYNDVVTEAKIRDHIGWVWYEITCILPASWQDKRVVLRIGSAAHHGVVWVDGVEVARHKGGYLPFEAEITELVGDAPGTTHRITIAVSNELDWTCIPSGEIIAKDNTELYPEGYRVQETYFDFYNYSGLHRPVKLYATPKNYIQDVTVNTEIQFKGITKEAVSAKVCWQVKCSAAGEPVKVFVKDAQGNIAAEASVQSDEQSFAEGTLTVYAPILWQPGKGYLYQLQIETEEDCYTLPFGIRSVRVEGTDFLINEKPFYFKGFGKHEDSDIRGKGLDEVLNIKDFNLLKWIGANSFRTSHYPYSEELMQLADREGMVLIDEVPAVGMCFWSSKKVFVSERVGEETLAHHLQMLEDMYDRDKNHPCVVMWSVANEAATNEEAALPYFTKVIDTMRRLDDTRPVTIVHTVGAKEDLVSQLVDVICLNRYIGWYTDHGQIDLIPKQLERELRQWYDKYEKPMIVSEFGADTIAGYHKMPPVAFTEEFQKAFLQAYCETFDKCDFVIGEHVWAFADFATKQGLNRVDGNKKGVFTRQRQPKMAAYYLQERWTRM